MTVIVIVLAVLGAWVLGSILLGVLIGRAIRLADHRAAAAVDGRVRKSGLTAAA